MAPSRRRKLRLSRRLSLAASRALATRASGEPQRGFLHLRRLLKPSEISRAEAEALDGSLAQSAIHFKLSGDEEAEPRRSSIGWLAPPSAARDDDDAALDVDDDDALDVRSLGARLGAFTAVLESSKGQSLADRAEAVHAHYRKVQLLKKNDTELRQKYKADRAARRLEVWRVGRATVSDCRVDVLGHGMRLDGFFVLNAFEGTLKELQAKVAQGVVSDMLRGAATHKLEQTRARHLDKLDDVRDKVKGFFGRA
mmetsp:Transcript_1913/g.5717  ORF Transcript_1913/g.5717 Transcript_1913/m.5717 type:complete len:254 (-) Transcript_1913:134-895(-)